MRPRSRSALTTTGPISRLPAPERGDGSLNGLLVANTKTAEKAARQAEKHRVRNVALRYRMRTAVRRVATAVTGGNKETAAASYREAVPASECLVSKQI